MNLFLWSSGLTSKEKQVYPFDGPASYPSTCCSRIGIVAPFSNRGQRKERNDGGKNFFPLLNPQFDELTFNCRGCFFLPSFSPLIFHQSSSGLFTREKNSISRSSAFFPTWLASSSSSSFILLCSNNMWRHRISAVRFFFIFSTLVIITAFIHPDKKKKGALSGCSYVMEKKDNALHWLSK